LGRGISQAPPDHVRGEKQDEQSKKSKGKAGNPIFGPSGLTAKNQPAQPAQLAQPTVKPTERTCRQRKRKVSRQAGMAS